MLLFVVMNALIGMMHHLIINLGGVAALVERSTSMPEYTGSIPTGGENFLSLKIFLHHSGGRIARLYAVGDKYTRVTMEPSLPNFVIKS